VASNSELCRVCLAMVSSIDIKLDSRQGFNHHLTKEDLLSAAQDRCPICRIVAESAFGYPNDELSVPRDHHLHEDGVFLKWTYFRENRDSGGDLICPVQLVISSGLPSFRFYLVSMKSKAP
jgi:hypothetical protein